MKSKDIVALLVTRYLNPEGNFVQLIVRGMTPIMLMQRSWAILDQPGLGGLGVEAPGTCLVKVAATGCIIPVSTR